MDTNVIEIVFGLIALVGLTFSFLNFREVRADLKLLSKKGFTNGRVSVAKSFRTSEVVRATIQVVHLTISFLAMSLPDSPSLPDGLPLSYYIADFLIVYGLVGSAALVGFLSAHAWYWRREFPIPATPNSEVLASIDASLGRLADRADEAEERRVENPAGDQDVARDHNGG